MEWQPIEIAPKDGTEIVLWGDKWRVCPLAMWMDVDGDKGIFGALVLKGSYLCVGVEEGVIGWNEDIEDGNMPTLWAPIPQHLKDAP